MYIEFGWEFIQKNRPKEAKICLEEGLKVEKDNFALKINLAHTYLLLNQYEKAVEDATVDFPDLAEEVMGNENDKTDEIS